MSDALSRAAGALKDALGEALNATPLTHTPSHTAAGDWTATTSYSVDLDAIARAAILAFLSGEDVVEACARQMNDDSPSPRRADLWEEMDKTGKTYWRTKAASAIAALRALVQEEK